MANDPKRYEVSVSPKASEQLVQHVRFLAQVSEEAADDMRQAIIVAVKSLSTMPERHMFITDYELPPNKYRKMLVQKRYLLIYQVKDDRVYIDYIVDCRQDYKWLL